MKFDLIGMSLSLIEAEDQSVEALCAQMGLNIPPIWPPEHNDAGTRQWLKNRLIATPQDAQWGGYYIVLNATELVGSAGFHGAPCDGEVEIGYSVIEPFQRQGLGTQATAMLCRMAFEYPSVTRIKAETLPDLIASQKVLLNNGFVLTDRRHDPEQGDIVTFIKHRPIQ